MHRIGTDSLDVRRELLRETRLAYAHYLCLRAEARTHGVSEASLAVLEASEHTAWDLTNVQWVEAHGPSNGGPAPRPMPSLIDAQGNLITGP